MKKLKSFPDRQLGYEPNPASAEFQIKDLVKSMNGFQIRTALAAKPKTFETVRLTLTPKEEELRRLVEDWQKSGPNVRKLLKERSELASMTRNGVTTFWPTDLGRGHLLWEAQPNKNDHLTPLEEAVQEFMNLITNPMWERLGGPCARCGNYYWKERLNQKTYCGRKCGSLDTAISATKRARQRTHEAKIKAAQTAINKWDSEYRKGDWKIWVERLTGQDRDRCSVHWLSRWVNKGTLIPPQNRVG